MAAERVMGTLIDVVKEAVLAAVREELAAHKEEVDELQNMMIAVEERNAATAAAMGRELAAVKGELAAHKEEEGDELRHTLTVLEERYEATVAVMEERGSKLAAVKREVTAVKGELAGVKSWLGEHLQLEEADRRRVAEMREMRRQGGGRGKELAAESAPVKGELAEHKQSTMLEQDKAVRRQMAEMRGQVEERERELAAVKGKLALHEDVISQDPKLTVELKIRDSEGNTKTVWEAIKSALKETDLNLKSLSGLSDAMLAHVSTMTHLTSIDMNSASGFSAEGIKHLYRMPLLKKLSLNFVDVSDTALEGIGSFTGLEHLYFQRTKVTDAGLQNLIHLSSLKSLNLSECKGVTNAGMVHVGRLAELENLWVRDTAVMADGLQQLSALTKLTTLRLPNGDTFSNKDVLRWTGRGR